MRWVTTTTVIGIMCCTAITTTGDEDGSTEGKGKSAEGSLLPEIVVSAPKESLHVASTSGGTLIPVNVVELPMSVEVVPVVIHGLIGQTDHSRVQRKRRHAGRTRAAGPHAGVS
jgi:hypothetical protein